MKEGKGGRQSRRGSDKDELIRKGRGLGWEGIRKKGKEEKVKHIKKSQRDREIDKQTKIQTNQENKNKRKNERIGKENW